MIKIIEDNMLHITLKINRFKKQNYQIVGVGYPFFYQKYLGIINLCDYFVDDTATANKVFPFGKCINSYQNLNFDKIVLVVFSYNRYNILLYLKKYVDTKNIFYMLDPEDGEVLHTYDDFEKSKLFIYRKHNNDNFVVQQSLFIKGKTLLDNNSKSKLLLNYLESEENARITNNSRNDIFIDSLYLKNNALLRINMDGEVNIGFCHMGSNTQIKVFSGKFEAPHVYFGNNCNVHVFSDLKVGKGTIISWNVSILEGDGHTINYDDKTTTIDNINIGQNVWIGNNVTILKGVKIGDGSVIGAGSLVTKSIPSKSLAFGTPAKVVKSNIDWKYEYNKDLT